MLWYFSNILMQNRYEKLQVLAKMKVFKKNHRGIHSWEHLLWFVKVKLLNRKKHRNRHDFIFTNIYPGYKYRNAPEGPLQKNILVFFWLTNIYHSATVLQLLQKQLTSYHTVCLGTFGNPFFKSKWILLSQLFVNSGMEL